MKISERTKREMIIFLIVAMGFIWLALSLENNYQNQRLEELKIEKQKLEKQNNELWKEYKNEIKIKTKTGSVRAKQIPVQTGGDDVPDTASEEIKEISWYSELDSCHYPKDGKCLVASGKIAEIGMVATWAYPIGTKLEIDGKIYTVEDRTNREYGHRIDVFTGYGDEAYQLAKANGIQYKNVKVIN